MSNITTLVPKPDKGGVLGRKLVVKANIFPVTALADLVAHQYDVAMDPELPSNLSRQVFRQCEVLIKKNYPDSWFVYDGQKIAYSTSLIPDTKLTVVVENDLKFILPPLPAAQRGGRGGARGGRGGSAPKIPAPELKLLPAKILTEKSAVGGFETVKVTIRKTTQVNMHRILQFAQGKCAEDEVVLQASNVLAVVLRHIPSMLFVPVHSNFFTPENRTPITGGLEVWRGYHQSVRSMMAGHLGINIDIASSVFRKGDISVIDYILEVCGGRNAADIARMPQAMLTKTMKGVQVVTDHRGDQKQRFRIGKISNLTAITMTFEDNDKKKVSVADYFKKEYNLKLKFPNLPLALKPNGKTAFPIECLKIVPAQRVRERLTGAQTSDMIRATVQKPTDRQEQIADAVSKTLKYEQNPYLDSFGLKVDKEMMKVNARVLPAPKVVFKNNSLPGQDGAWNITKSKLIDTPLLASFAFVFFVQIDQQEAQAIRDVLCKTWVDAGMKIKNLKVPVIIANPNPEGNIKGALINAFKTATQAYKTRCQLLVCVVETEVKGLYETIKRVCLCEAGVVSQCLLFKNVRRAAEIKDQYANNVGLKVNIKIGGASNHVDNLPLATDVTTMFMGADVTHPAPGSAAPSIAAVVASYDSKVTKYNTYCRAQGHRVEIIESMHEITLLALRDYKKSNSGKFPARIIMYRDGVASGQFVQVRDSEIRQMKTAMESVKCTSKITFVIVQKRHHVRLFPIDNNADRSGNCLPGTVIDTQITHPSEFNFILQSHAGLQGMSRPTLYHVIHDESKMTSDQIQRITFSLCFLSERATRSIAMASPAYRAHIAAFYARMFIDGEDMSDTASKASGQPSAFGLKPFVAGIEQTMYYM